MKYARSGYLLGLATLLLLVTGCGLSGIISQSNQSVAPETETMTLEDHLRRINGVRIQGSGDYAKVFIGGTRGASNASRGLGQPDNKADLNMKDSDKRQPLFVVDGQKLGRNYPDIRDMFSPGEIKSVKVLSASEASQYGSQGGHGVIVITTKSAASRESS